MSKLIGISGRPGINWRKAGRRWLRNILKDMDNSRLR
jgi:hypothetical protein